MPARKKLTDAGRARIEEVAQIRANTPTDKELALECGIAPCTVRHVMDEYRYRKREGLSDSRGTARVTDADLDAIADELMSARPDVPEPAEETDGCE